MGEYRLYGMVGTMIISGEHVACRDDADAAREARLRLERSAGLFDAVEVWQGDRLVCRRDQPAPS